MSFSLYIYFILTFWKVPAVYQRVSLFSLAKPLDLYYNRFDIGPNPFLWRNIWTIISPLHCLLICDLVIYRPCCTFASNARTQCWPGECKFLPNCLQIVSGNCHKGHHVCHNISILCFWGWSCQNLGHGQMGIFYGVSWCATESIWLFVKAMFNYDAKKQNIGREKI